MSVTEAWTALVKSGWVGQCNEEDIVLRLNIYTNTNHACHVLSGIPLIDFSNYSFHKYINDGVQYALITSSFFYALSYFSFCCVNVVFLY